MRTNEDWIAEQARLIDLEDGFGPAAAPARPGGGAEVQEDSAARPAAA
jgi:hypothetical protein